MKWKSLLFVLTFATITTFFISCDEVDSTVCTTDDPINDLPWLANMKDSIEDRGWRGFVNSYTYRGNQVIFINPNPTAPEVENLCTARDCNGNVLCSWGGPNLLLTCPSFWSEVSNEQALWSN